MCKFWERDFTQKIYINHQNLAYIMIILLSNIDRKGMGAVHWDGKNRLKGSMLYALTYIIQVQVPADVLKEIPAPRTPLDMIVKCNLDNLMHNQWSSASVFVGRTWVMQTTGVFIYLSEDYSPACVNPL